MTALDEVRAEALAELGYGSVVTDHLERVTYACDGLTGYRVTPALVVLPRSTEEVAVVVRACARRGVPFVARGSGTGLSGGALPDAEGVLIVTSRMRRILEIDPDNQRMTVEPGVTNLAMSKAVAPHGLYYAPDPSSQVVCSVGGNVAENSGGAHCLKYGFTTHHVLGLEVVLPDGSVVALGGPRVETPGYDLRGVFIGSEGTLGIATKITVRLLRLPESVATLVADFPEPSVAGGAVSGIIGSGIVPAAVEMLDHLAIQACEAATGAGYSLDAGAALVVELDGPDAECRTRFAEVEAICRDHGATRVRVAGDQDERALIWKGRKAAFAAMGRLSAGYFVQDGVIPRTSLGEVLGRIAALSEDAGLRVANVFHAGDGNLHPLVLYDPARSGEPERAEELATRIIELCVDAGGSITGEHGVGVDKACSMPKMFSEDDLAVMQRVRAAFDPAGICNPGKVFPTPRLCGEVIGPYRPHPLEEAGLAERW
ncbi:MAG TPA: FAD-linked oxidase C-terminal domain-containing protein [Acidimicrobiales bacterium]|nr:FAD-linked oxidase C-terminal domain-containing protein [Acidimicrobiales bacterium]